MAERKFTLEEAQALVPVLGSLLKTAIDGKKAAEDIEQEFKVVSNRVFLNGGFETEQIEQCFEGRFRLCRHKSNAEFGLRNAGSRAFHVVI